mmetsp:Transcript_18314/g.49239  ORF Transcript_18314/g.49239 Transcript_18314/m.49239 type:complete len:206 (-) Transcript_18314:202-819(-)
MDLFTEYESDYTRLRVEIDDEIARGRGSVFPVEKWSSKVEATLRQMDMEVRSIAPDERSAVETRLRQYRAEVKDRRQGIAELKAATEDAWNIGQSGKDRERLINTNDHLERSANKLEKAQVEALEIERLGQDIMGDLHQQREVVLRVRGNVGQLGENTSMARRILESMSRRAMVNRLLTTVVVCFVSFLLVAAFLAVMTAPRSSR